jgi:hypothetical protein
MTKVYTFFFLRHSSVYNADRRNNSFWCLLQRFSRPQDAGTPSDSTQHTWHLVGHPSKNYLSPMLLDFSDQMGTGPSNVARRRSRVYISFNHGVIFFCAPLNFKDITKRNVSRTLSTPFISNFFIHTLLVVSDLFYFVP